MTVKIPIKTTKQYVTMVSGVVRLSGQVLTDTEIEVLATFVDLQKELNNMGGLGQLVDAFSPEAKKEAAKRLQREDFNTLNNFLKSLCDKKVLTRIEGGYLISPLFIPDSQPLTIDYNG